MNRGLHEYSCAHLGRVPRRSDGIVFQVRVVHGLQRFHMSCRKLEDPSTSRHGLLMRDSSSFSSILVRPAASGRLPVQARLHSSQLTSSRRANWKFDRIFMRSRDVEHNFRCSGFDFICGICQASGGS